jgi:drug/metabolite transporter superfamily protein YnfA
METFIAVVIAVGAVLAGLVLVSAGVFSLVSLLWDDLLESDEPVRLDLPGAA